jgi:hypothetical protein
MGLSTWYTTLYALALTVTLLPKALGYTVMGVPAGVDTDTGERPIRQDLKDFQVSGAAFDLYVQALDQFQKDDQSDFLSYYEVAGNYYPLESISILDRICFLIWVCLRVKVFMDTPIAHGMVSRVPTRRGIARMGRPSSRPGIGRILPCGR